ncbi:hypothetical protein HY486_02705 [Candidatus Woesearchaeota archaeon]|nr:hypothetical protein [Candidatus Woesearchaeota archaeon]
MGFGDAVKRSLGSACLGAAYRNFAALIDPPKVTFDSHGDNWNQRRESKEYSVIGGAVRGAVTHVLIMNAWNLLGDDIVAASYRLNENFGAHVSRVTNTPRKPEEPARLPEQNHPLTQEDIRQLRGQHDGLDNILGQ